MKTITIREVNVNGVVIKTYNESQTIQSALRAIYGTQGALYLDVFGVSEEDAKGADWHPQDDNFSTSCDGWNKAMAEKTIVKTITERTVDVKELL